MSAGETGQDRAASIGVTSDGTVSIGVVKTGVGGTIDAGVLLVVTIVGQRGRFL